MPFSIGVGVLSVAISIAIFAVPAFSAIFASFIIGLSLLIIGMYMIAAGLSGRAGSVILTTADVR